MTLRQVCAELRKAGVTIPIIAMTGNVDPASIAMYKSVGFNGLLAKPFSKVRQSACALLRCFCCCGGRAR
jgi:CheY-like chemotaxis protein